MSYILDALKKAEKERELTKIPTIETVHDLTAKKKTGIWIASGCGAICLITVAWLLFSTSSGRVESKDQVHSALNTDSEIKDPNSLPENRELAGQRSKIPVPETTDTPFADMDEAYYQFEETYPENPGQNENSYFPFVEITGETTRKSPPAYDSTVLFAPDAVRRELQQLLRNPPSLREIVASMKMEVHVYSENQDRRMVYINGKKYVEGDYMEHDCVLESITPEGVLLKRGEETAILRSGG